jgi:hypothetical protein
VSKKFKKIIRETIKKQLYTNKLDNLEEMSTNLLRLNHEELDFWLNKSGTRRLNQQSKISQPRKAQSHMGFAGKF